RLRRCTCSRGRDLRLSRSAQDQCAPCRGEQNMPIKLTDIERLAQILERSGVDTIEIEEPGQSLKLVVDTGPRMATSPTLAAPAVDHSVIAKADVAGHFLVAHPWRDKPFVAQGQRIEAGAIVGLV